MYERLFVVACPSRVDPFWSKAHVVGSGEVCEAPLFWFSYGYVLLVARYQVPGTRYVITYSCMHKRTLETGVLFAMHSFVWGG